MPPPPRPVVERGAWDDPQEPLRPPARSRSRPRGAPFDADMEVTELDDRERPGPTWEAQGCELSRSHLVLRSRRMCYPGRTLLVAIHLIDDRPVPLLGRVYSCDYDGDGQYRIGLDLQAMPERPEIRDWVLSRG